LWKAIFSPGEVKDEDTSSQSVQPQQPQPSVSTAAPTVTEAERDFQIVGVGTEFQGAIDSARLAGIWTMAVGSVLATGLGYLVVAGIFGLLGTLSAALGLFAAIAIVAVGAWMYFSAESRVSARFAAENKAEEEE